MEEGVRTERLATQAAVGGGKRQTDREAGGPRALLGGVLRAERAAAGSITRWAGRDTCSAEIGPRLCAKREPDRLVSWLLLLSCWTRCTGCWRAMGPEAGAVSGCRLSRLLADCSWDLAGVISERELPVIGLALALHRLAA